MTIQSLHGLDTGIAIADSRRHRANETQRLRRQGRPVGRRERNFNRNNYRLHMPDLYWLAGLLEGEGCFSIDKPKRRSPTPVIVLCMTDRDVMDRVAHMFGGVSVRPGTSNHLGTKPVYQLRLSARRAHAWMMTLWPLMGERRQTRILEVLRACTPTAPGR